MAVQPLTDSAPPLPGSVVAAQEWREVAFVHWRVDASTVTALLPPGVRPDLDGDGTTWVGLIAFRLGRARLGPLPPVPVFGDFTEVNVRLYGVDAGGRRGVVFRSLEAASLPAVLGARALFSLPYFWARTGQRRTPDGWEYASARAGRGPRSRLRVAVGDGRVTDPAARFLTARWGLFESRFGRTVWLPNAHEPWTLRPARVVGLRDELVAAAGLPGVAERAPDSVLFSPGVSSRFARGGTLQ